MRLGIVGFRGMVGSVLLDRMKECQDFENFETTLFSESTAGQQAPNLPNTYETIASSRDLARLKTCDVIISCQGSAYTEEVLEPLRGDGFKGYFVDASSALRGKKDATLLLDPVNKKQIVDAIKKGYRDFAGANCTVSLMLLAIGSLIKNNLVENISFMSYQAASGAGASAIDELIKQQDFYANAGQKIDVCGVDSILEKVSLLHRLEANQSFPKQNFSTSLAFNILPFIDFELTSGQSKEEWKAGFEAQKITTTDVKMDGTCVRVPTLRSHAQGLMIKLTKNIGIDDINHLLINQHEWLRFVENTRSESITKLTPQSVAGTLDIAVGRVRKSTLGDHYLNVFTVGDQLLWGAAEPLRRMLTIIREF